jgi:hypothetical protein
MGYLPEMWRDFGVAVEGPALGAELLAVAAASGAVLLVLDRQACTG